MSNKRNNVLYIGVTRDLEYRVWEHKNKVRKGFTSKYNVNKLVYYEEYELATEAFEREKQIKRWRRSKKEWLIDQLNAERFDLSEDWF